MSWLSKLAIRCIKCYQQNGGGKELFYVDCNFTPSCSEYAKESLHRFGFCQGSFLTFKRISRCTQRVGCISEASYTVCLFNTQA